MSKKENNKTKSSELNSIFEILAEDVASGKVTIDDLENLHKSKSCLCPVCTINRIQNNLVDLLDDLEYVKYFFIDDEEDEEEETEDEEEVEEDNATEEDILVSQIREGIQALNALLEENLK